MVLIGNRLPSAVVALLCMTEISCGVNYELVMCTKKLVNQTAAIESSHKVMVPKAPPFSKRYLPAPKWHLAFR